MRDMMTHTGLNENLNTDQWLECASTMTKLENIMLNPHKEKCTHKKFYRKMPDYKNYLKLSDKW